MATKNDTAAHPGGMWLYEITRRNCSHLVFFNIQNKYSDVTMQSTKLAKIAVISRKRFLRYVEQLQKHGAVRVKPNPKYAPKSRY